MDDTLALLDSIAKNPILKKIPLILFLNKADLFEKNLRANPLSDKFPNYKDGPDFASAISFMKKTFSKIINVSNQNSIIHITQATDVSSFSKLVVSITVIVMQQSLSKSGFV